MPVYSSNSVLVQISCDPDVFFHSTERLRRIDFHPGRSTIKFEVQAASVPTLKDPGHVGVIDGPAAVPIVPDLCASGQSSPTRSSRRRLTVRQQARDR